MRDVGGGRDLTRSSDDAEQLLCNRRREREVVRERVGGRMVGKEMR